MSLLVIASGLYRLLARRMRGYGDAQARHIFHDAKVVPERQEMHFTRYEPFTHPVMAYDEDLGIKLPYPNSPGQGYGPRFEYLDPAYAAEIVKHGRVPGETARTFAQGLVEYLETDKEVVRAFGEVSSGDISPQKGFHPLVGDFLGVFLKAQGISELPAWVDDEGYRSRNVSLGRNYRLLGTSAFPEAAVLSKGKSGNPRAT